MAIRRAVLAAFIGLAAIAWLGLRTSVVAVPVGRSAGPPSASAERIRDLFATYDHRQTEDRARQRPLVGPTFPPGKFLRDIQRLFALRELDVPATELMQLAESIYRGLLAAGASAAPEVLDFLESGEDLPLPGRPGTAFDFQSLRLALIDALRQVGGRAAVSALLYQLQLTDSDAELEALADALEWLQPGAYTADILERAMARLTNLTAEPDPGMVMDVAPLFRVLQDFGQDGMVPMLQGLPYWLRAYADVTLANLPNGEGIEPLTLSARRDLHRPGDSRALHLLAQLAVANPPAEQALLALALAGEIPDTAWPLIADILIGDRQLQLEEPPFDPRLIGSLRGSNPFAVHSIVDRQVQLIYSVNYSAVLTADGAAARLAMIDRMLEATLSPAARAALWSARDLLTGAY